MDTFKCKQISIIVTREDHFLSITLPERLGFLSDFLECNLADITRLKELIRQIKDLNECEFIIERDTNLAFAQEYNIDLSISLKDYVSVNEDQINIRCDDFLEEKLKINAEYELLSYLMTKFPKIVQEKVRMSDDVYSLVVCKNNGIIIRNIRPIKYSEFSTLAFLDLLQELVSFLEDYNDNKIPGLRPINK